MSDSGLHRLHHELSQDARRHGARARRHPGRQRTARDITLAVRRNRRHGEAA